MKRFKFFWLAVAAFGVITWSSCSKEEVQTLSDYLVSGTGTWTVTENKTEEYVNDSLVFEFDFPIGTLKFESGGTGTITVLGDTEPFGWSYNEAANQVTVMPDSADNMTYDVITNTATSQRWRYEMTDTSGGVTSRTVETFGMTKVE